MEKRTIEFDKDMCKWDCMILVVTALPAFNFKGQPGWFEIQIARAFWVAGPTIANYLW